MRNDLSTIIDALRPDTYRRNTSDIVSIAIRVDDLTTLLEAARLGETVLRAAQDHNGGRI